MKFFYANTPVPHFDPLWANLYNAVCTVWEIYLPRQYWFLVTMVMLDSVISVCLHYNYKGNVR